MFQKRSLLDKRFVNGIQINLFLFETFSLLVAYCNFWHSVDPEKNAGLTRTRTSEHAIALRTDRFKGVALNYRKTIVAKEDF